MPFLSPLHPTEVIFFLLVAWNCILFSTTNVKYIWFHDLKINLKLNTIFSIISIIFLISPKSGKKGLNFPFLQKNSLTPWQRKEEPLTYSVQVKSVSIQHYSNMNTGGIAARGQGRQHICNGGYENSNWR